MPDAPVPHPLLLYDGVCNLCHGAVQWILKRDRHARFRFAALESRVAQEALDAAGFAGPLPDSVVVIDRGQVLVESAAALRVTRVLGFPWNALLVFWIIPRPLRDALYRFVARRRYRWFGKKESCPMPTPETIARFLDVGEEIPSRASEDDGTPGQG